MIGILVTSKIEWEQVLKLYNINEINLEKYPYGEYYKGNLFNKEIVFFRSNSRKVYSSGAVQYMIDKFELEKLIFIGTCVMVDDLDYGDIIIPDEVVEYDLAIREIQPLISESMIIKLSPVNIDQNYVIGMIGTSDKALVLWKDYLKLKEETNICASDLESAAVAKICKINNVKCVIIKGVTDKPIKGEDGYDEQVEVFEENVPKVMKNILENYLTEVL